MKPEFKLLITSIITGRIGRHKVCHTGVQLWLTVQLHCLITLYRMINEK